MHTHTTNDTAPTQPGQPAKKLGPHAPRWKRLLAAILDSVIFFCPFPLLLPFADTTVPIADAAIAFFLYLYIITLLALIITQCVLVSIRGQSLGKIVLRIRITTLDGRNPGFLRAILLRCGVIGIISMIPGLGPILCIIGLLMIFCPDRRCLHDYIAGTCVIQLPEKQRTPNAQSLKKGQLPTSIPYYSTPPLPRTSFFNSRTKKIMQNKKTMTTNTRTNETATNIAGCLFAAIYFGISTIQLFAIQAGIVTLWGWPAWAGYIVAFLLGYLPVVGTIIGIVGAIGAWNWSVLAAIALFAGPYILAILFGGIASLFSSNSEK